VYCSRTCSNSAICRKEGESRLKISLAAVHDQLDQLGSDTAAERGRLQRDNARLQDLVSEIRLKSQKESESLRAEMERVAEEMRAEVKEAESGMFAATRERNVMEQVRVGANVQSCVLICIRN
jgi:flagellar motility protein MotE (MotC chaperone)